MAILDSDAFAYSNGALATVSAGKWTKLSGFADLTVASNAVTGTASTDCPAVITAWGGSTTSQYAQVTVKTIGADGGPTVYSDGIDTFYMLSVSVNAWNVYKCVAGVFTVIDADPVVNPAPADDSVCYFENQDGWLTTRLDGEILTVCIDSAIASGKPGIFVWSNALALESWEAGSPVSPRVGSTYEFFPKPILSELDHIPDGTEPSDIS